MSQLCLKGEALIVTNVDEGPIREYNQCCRDFNRKQHPDPVASHRRMLEAEIGDEVVQVASYSGNALDMYMVAEFFQDHRTDAFVQIVLKRNPYRHSSLGCDIVNAVFPSSPQDVDELVVVTQLPNTSELREILEIDDDSDKSLEPWCLIARVFSMPSGKQVRRFVQPVSRHDFHQLCECSLGSYSNFICHASPGRWNKPEVTCMVPPLSNGRMGWVASVSHTGFCVVRESSTGMVVGSRVLEEPPLQSDRVSLVTHGSFLFVAWTADLSYCGRVDLLRVDVVGTDRAHVKLLSSRILEHMVSISRVALSVNQSHCVVARTDLSHDHTAVHYFPASSLLLLKYDAFANDGALSLTCEVPPLTEQHHFKEIELTDRYLVTLETDSRVAQYFVVVRNSDIVQARFDSSPLMVIDMGHFCCFPHLETGMHVLDFFSSRLQDSLCIPRMPQCWLVSSLFPSGTPGCYLLGSHLREGSTVIAADGTTTLIVTKIEEHVTSHVIRLEAAGCLSLQVTPNHRVPVYDSDPEPRSSIKSAEELQVGDRVSCNDGQVRALTVVEAVAYEEPSAVLAISFSPDRPVAVIDATGAGIATLGVRKRQLRRGGMNRRGHPGTRLSEETLSIPDTASGMYSD